MRFRGAGLAVAGLAAFALAVFLYWRVEGTGSGHTPEHRKDPSSLAQRWQAVLEAQRAARTLREGSAGTLANPREKITRRRLAAQISRDELNAAAQAVNRSVGTSEVVLSGDDLAGVFGRCVRHVDGYFPRLRYGAELPLALPPRVTAPLANHEPPTRHRCEGGSGMVYLDRLPQQHKGLRRCWRQLEPHRTQDGEDAGSFDRRWLELHWDDDRSRWSVFTELEQRQADRARFEAAKRRLPEDVKRMAARAERSGKRRIPRLEREVNKARERLVGLSGETRRRVQTGVLEKREGALRRALVNARFGEICERAARFALASKRVALGL